MINNISPQKVQHSDGYTVQVADRFTVEYLDAHCQARIEVDFGETVGVYFSTLVVKNNNGAELNLNLSENAGYVVEVEITQPINAQVGVVGSQGAAQGGGNQLHFVIPPQDRVSVFKVIGGRVLP